MLPPSQGRPAVSGRSPLLTAADARWQAQGCATPGAGNASCGYVVGRPAPPGRSGVDDADFEQIPATGHPRRGNERTSVRHAYATDSHIA